jgi:hypothetical protein
MNVQIKQWVLFRGNFTKYIFCAFSKDNMKELDTKDLDVSIIYYIHYIKSL